MNYTILHKLLRQKAKEQPQEDLRDTQLLARLKHEQKKSTMGYFSFIPLGSMYYTKASGLAAAVLTGIMLLQMETVKFEQVPLQPNTLFSDSAQHHDWDTSRFNPVDTGQIQF